MRASSDAALVLWRAVDVQLDADFENPVGGIATSAGLDSWAYFFNLPVAERERRTVTMGRVKLFEAARTGKLRSFIAHGDTVFATTSAPSQRIQRRQGPAPASLRNTFDYVRATDLCRVSYVKLPDDEYEERARPLGQVFKFTHFEHPEHHCTVLVRCTCRVLKHYGGCVHIILAHELEGA